MLTLICNQGSKHVVPRALVKDCKIIQSMLVEDDDDEDDVTIPLPNIDAETLTKYIEFKKYYEKDPYPTLPSKLTSNDLKFAMNHEWYLNFLNWNPINTRVVVDAPDDSQETKDKNQREREFIKNGWGAIKLIRAGDYLDDDVFHQLAAFKVASLVYDKTPPKLIEIFDLKCSLSSEEMIEYRKSNMWTEGMKKPSEVDVGMKAV